MLLFSILLLTHLSRAFRRLCCSAARTRSQTPVGRIAHTGSTRPAADPGGHWQHECTLLLPAMLPTFAPHIQTNPHFKVHGTFPCLPSTNLLPSKLRALQFRSFPWQLVITTLPSWSYIILTCLALLCLYLFPHINITFFSFYTPHRA